MKKEIKLIIISQYYEPDITGDVTRLKNALPMLRKYINKITLITTIPHYPDGNHKGFKIKSLLKIEWEDEIRIIRIWMPPIPHKGLWRRLLLYSWFAIIATLTLLTIGKADVIWAFSQKVFSTYAALTGKILWRSRLVSDVTDIWPEALVNTGYLVESSSLYKVAEVLAKVAYQVSNKITTLTQEMARMLTMKYSVPPERIIIVPNIAKKLSRTEYPTKINKELLYFGNIGKNYDFKPLLTLAQKIEDLGIIIKLIGNGEEFEKVKNEIRIRKLKNVKLVEKYLTREELLNMALHSMALLLPMRKHKYKDASLPIKFIEYLSIGRPIIVIGDGIHADIVRKNNIGIAASHKKLDEIVEYIKKLIKINGSYYKYITEKSWTILDKKFSEKKMEDSLKIVFNIG